MKHSFSKRFLSVFLSIALIMSYLPLSVLAAQSHDITDANNIITDPGTADAWEDIMGTDADGNRYAGRVWVDKSVYKDGDTVKLNRKGNEDSTFTVDLDEENGEYFQVVFSALGSSMSTNTQTYASRPLDVVLVLDTSTSMATKDEHNITRFQHMIEAANLLLEDLLKLGDVRVAIVSFNADSDTIISLNKYDNGVVLSVNDYSNRSDHGVITAKDKNGRELGKDDGYTSGTNLQDGINRGMDILANAQNTDGRAPVAIVLADGRANRAVDTEWYNPKSNNISTDEDAGIMLSTLLNAAYGRTRVEKNYNTDMTVYGIGIDLEPDSNDFIFLNPGAKGSNGFNAENNDEDVKIAWNTFVTWCSGDAATMTFGKGKNPKIWIFDHNWPSYVGVTTDEIATNINYVDDYQDVDSADLGDAFDEILQELSVGAFNPISDTNNGATGVEDTPLIYVDNIGQYMEVKNIQALQVFGNTYSITKNNNGTYSVAAGSGVNPTTNENWNTANDIRISVNQNADGTQQLRVYINQEILPILLDEITVTTENGETTRTLEEHGYPPLRIYYTVGIDEDILLPNGEVNPLKLDSDYAYLNNDGTASFYSNAFGQLNTADADGDGLVDEGDAHVGFVPSHDNRYYYHQAHQEIFIDAKNKNGSAIQWDDDMYGVPWDENKYDLTVMTYADLDTVRDSDRVYTYVTFVRPTGNGITAEEVTYLVYTTWGALKSAVTYHDRENNVNLNGGAAIDPDRAAAVVGAYMNSVRINDSDLIAILGMKSRRVSRLSNMFETKANNVTGTAETSYAPEYNDGAYENDDMHEHSEVIVWLGNNGKLTLPVSSGIQISKDVTELADGSNANEVFTIYARLDMSAQEIGDIAVTDTNGDALAATKYAVSAHSGNVLVTLYLADGESAVIMGTPAGTAFSVTEAEHAKYEYTYTGATVTVAGTIVEGVVTNSPILPGTLFITKEVVHAYGGEAFPKNYEFDFMVTFKDADNDPIANHTFKLENNNDASLTELTTDENGVMRGKLKHSETVNIFGIPAGTTVTVEEVNIPANYTKTEYSSSDYSGAVADNDGVVTINAGRNATVVVTNTYTPDEVDVNINFEGTKNFDATEINADSEFTFKLQKYANRQWTDVEGQSVTVIKGENASKEFAFTPLALEFNEPGVTYYRIIEVEGENTDITYDRSVYAFSVNVTIDNNGELKTEVVGNEIDDGDHIFAITGDSERGYKIKTVFTNEYHTTATSVKIEKTINDTANSGKTAAGFVIETYEATVDAQGNWTQGDFIRSTLTDAQGEALLVRNYDNTDFEQNDTDNDNKVTYHFIIKEKKSNVFDGWTYDTTEYHVTVVLTRDSVDDQINADFDIVKVAADGSTDMGVNGNEATITFENIYNPSNVEIFLNTLVKKDLEGRDMVAGEFKFALFKNGESSLTNTDKALMVGTNDENGNVLFTSTIFGVEEGLVNKDTQRLHFSQVGKYEFDIVEINENRGGVTYDSTVYDLVVEVTDNNGALEANLYFEDSVSLIVTFNNAYTVKPIEVVINGIKTLEVINGNKTMRAGDYTFYLYNEAGTKIAETTNLANRTFAFGAIRYDIDDIGKTFTYTVKEVAPDSSTDGSYSAGGVSWSGQSFTVTVKINDNGDGTISAEVTGNGSQNIVFVNEYSSAPVSVTLPGKKNLENRPLTAGEFTFALYSTDRNFANPTPVKENITHDVDGNFDVELGTLEEGRHYFLLKENIPAEHAKGIHYSVAEFRITIVVTDNGTGQMTYTKSVVNANIPGVTDAAIEFTNVYIPEPGELPLSGTKIYNGVKELEDDVFSVGLYDSEEALLQTALIKADGSFTFENLKYQAADVGNTYTYTMKEIIPDGATDNGDGTYTLGNDIYDGSIYTLTVSVTDDDKDGALEIDPVLKKNNAPVDGITFTNTFVPDPITVDFDIIKTVINKGSEEIGPEGFEFLLKALEDGVDDITVKVDENGNAKFTLTFTEDDIGNTYTYTLTEVNDGKENVTYSDAEYTVTVAIELNENNELVAILTMDRENVTAVVAKFENIYDYTPVPGNPGGPQTGDNSKLHLWSSLLFVSGGGIVGTTLYGRKKKEEEAN